MRTYRSRIGADPPNNDSTSCAHRWIFSAQNTRQERDRVTAKTSIWGPDGVATVVTRRAPGACQITRDHGARGTALSTRPASSRGSPMIRRIIVIGTCTTGETRPWPTNRIQRQCGHEHCTPPSRRRCVRCSSDTVAASADVRIRPTAPPPTAVPNSGSLCIRWWRVCIGQALVGVWTRVRGGGCEALHLFVQLAVVRAGPGDCQQRTGGASLLKCRVCGGLILWYAP